MNRLNRRRLLKTAALGSAAAAILPASVRAASAAGSDRPAFVLIHGSWHGAWAWNEMTPLLAEAGHASIAIDLPARHAHEIPGIVSETAAGQGGHSPPRNHRSPASLKRTAPTRPSPPSSTPPGSATARSYWSAIHGVA